MTSACPSRETLQQFVASDISHTTDSELELHLNHCESCQVTLDSLFRDSRQCMMNLSLVGKDSQSAEEYPKPRVAGYEITELAGAGGQGLIYRARELNTGRWVAVKMLRHIGLDPSLLEDSLMREARSIGQLNHPNIVRLHAMVRTDQGPALILDWVEGGSLQEYLKQNRPSENEIVSIVMQLADAMVHAHENGVLHRDIKPSNVLLQGGGLNHPMLCDFGLAKTRQGDLDFSSTTMGIGTAGYMAPEMISRRFGRISPASDIYSLGALLYRMLTGVIPHEADSPFETLERTCDRNVIAPSFFNKTLDWNLETICLKCLDRDSHARYRDVRELKTDLQRYQNRERIIAGRVNWQRRLKTWSKEHPWIAILSVSLCLLFLTSTLILTQLLRRSQISQRRAETELARSVETFRLSTPLIKRFIQLSSFNPAETKRIVKIAELLKSMGEGEGNPRQRFDLIYSGLEIANELYNVIEHRTLAISMTRNARESLGRLINEHGSELDRQALLMVDGKIGISMLDQAMVRYAHSCIQLFEMLKDLPGNEINCKQYLMEAISTAEKVTVKNPEVDEAFSDLANYNISLYYFYAQEDKSIEASDSLRKSFLIHDRMLKIYPHDFEKIHFWINGLNFWLDSEYQINSNSKDLIHYMALAKTKMYEIKSNNLPAWSETWPFFLDCMIMENWVQFSNSEHRVKLAVVDALMTTWHEMYKGNAAERKNLERLLIMQLDKMTLLQLNNGSKAMNDYFDSVEKFWLSNGDKPNYRLYQALFYLSKPDAEVADFKKADDILKDLPEEDMEIQIYREICKALLTAQPFEMSKLHKNSLFEVQMDIHNYLIDLQNKSQKANPIAIKDEIQKKYQNRLISIRARQQIRKVFEKNQPEPIRQDCLQAEGL